MCNLHVTFSSLFMFDTLTFNLPSIIILIPDLVSVFGMDIVTLILLFYRLCQIKDYAGMLI